MNCLATILLSLIVAGMFAPLADGDETFAIGLKKQLLVDDHVIARHENVTRTLNQPFKHGAVLKPTLPSDMGGIFAMYITVVRNEKDDKFQMWYEAGDIVRPDGSVNYRGTSYAESEDGIHWTKPLVSADGRSNIVLPTHAPLTSPIPPMVFTGNLTTTASKSPTERPTPTIRFSGIRCGRLIDSVRGPTWPVEASRNGGRYASCTTKTTTS